MCTCVSLIRGAGRWGGGGSRGWLAMQSRRASFGGRSTPGAADRCQGVAIAWSFPYHLIGGSSCERVGTSPSEPSRKMQGTG